MRLTPSDLVTYYRPTQCGLRVFLRAKGTEEAKPSPYEEVLRRLGIIHERKHLETLGPYLDLSGESQENALWKTSRAVNEGSVLVYQSAFLAGIELAGRAVEVYGRPDFLIPTP